MRQYKRFLAVVAISGLELLTSCAAFRIRDYPDPIKNQKRAEFPITVEMQRELGLHESFANSKCVINYTERDGEEGLSDPGEIEYINPYKFPRNRAIEEYILYKSKN